MIVVSSQVLYLKQCMGKCMYRLICTVLAFKKTHSLLHVVEEKITTYKCSNSVMLVCC